MVKEYKWTSLKRAGPYAVGVDGIEQIIMKNNGEGPMGYYNVIYVYKDSVGPWLAMPAHLTDFWEYKHS